MPSFPRFFVNYFPEITLFLAQNNETVIQIKMKTLALFRIHMQIIALHHPEKGVTVRQDDLLETAEGIIMPVMQVEIVGSAWNKARFPCWSAAH